MSDIFDEIFGPNFTRIVIKPAPDAPVLSKWAHQEAAGFLPEIFDENDPRPAAAQIDERYAHGGGWRPNSGFRLRNSHRHNEAILTFPGDPPFREINSSRLPLTGEILILFERGWLAVVQQETGRFEVTRMD